MSGGAKQALSPFAAITLRSDHLPLAAHIISQGQPARLQFVVGDRLHLGRQGPSVAEWVLQRTASISEELVVRLLLGRRAQ